MSIEKEKSNYKQLFMDYCKDKIKNLGNITVDEEIMEDNYINDTKIREHSIRSRWYGQCQ